MNNHWRFFFHPATLSIRRVYWILQNEPASCKCVVLWCIGRWFSIFIWDSGMELALAIGMNSEKNVYTLYIHYSYSISDAIFTLYGPQSYRSNRNLFQQKNCPYEFWDRNFSSLLSDIARYCSTNWNALSAIKFLLLAFAKSIIFIFSFKLGMQQP